MGKAKHPHDPLRPTPRAVKLALAKNDMKALEKVLTPRQRAFCYEYVVDFNGQAAAIRAGYAVPYADKQAHILLHHEGVARFVDHLSQSKAAKITAVNPDYVIGKVTAIISKEGVTDGNALRALELLARHLGMFIDRTELTGKDGGPIQTQEIEEQANSFIEQLRSIQRDQKIDVVLE